MEFIKGRSIFRLLWQGIALFTAVLLMAGSALYGSDRKSLRREENNFLQTRTTDIEPDWIEIVEIDGKKYKKVYMSPDKLVRKFGTGLDLSQYKGYYYQAVLPDIYPVADSIAADPLVDSVQVLDSLTALIYITRDNCILKYGIESLDPEDGEYSGYHLYMLPVPAPYLPIYPDYPKDRSEIIKYRTPYSRIFRNDDGTCTAILTIRSTSYPIKEGENIKWIDIPPDEPIPNSILRILEQGKDQENLNRTRHATVVELDNDGLSAYNYFNELYINVGAGGDFAWIRKHLYQRYCCQFSTSGFPEFDAIIAVKYRTYVTNKYPEEIQINSDGTYVAYKITPLMRNFYHNLNSYSNDNYNDLYNDIADGTIYYQGSSYWCRDDGYVYATFNRYGRADFASRVTDGYYSTGLKDLYEYGNSDSTTWEAIVISPTADRLEVTFTPSHGIEEDALEEIPKTFYLSQNFPNPARSVTTISFGVPRGAYVILEIYDLAGKKVRILKDGMIKAGHHTVIWDETDESGQRVAPGIYFYRMEAGKYTETRKLALLQ